MKRFSVYPLLQLPLDTEHTFDCMVSSWFTKVQACCTCGWQSRPYWSMRRAADALISHEASEGTLLEVHDE